MKEDAKAKRIRLAGIMRGLVVRNPKKYRLGYDTQHNLELYNVEYLHLMRADIPFYHKIMSLKGEK
jgi:hypothetical protein